MLLWVRQNLPAPNFAGSFEALVGRSAAMPHRGILFVSIAA
jgi:hypothetical protein